MSSVTRNSPELPDTSDDRSLTELADIQVFGSDIEVVDGPDALGPWDGVEAIVVDIDDTLFLKRDYVRSGFDAVGRWVQRELGIVDFGQRAWAAFESGARETIFDEVLTGLGARSDDAVITALIARYRTHAPTIALAADAQTALDRWHGQVKLAAVTDGPVSSQLAKARALGLDRWTSLIVCTASLGPGKDKPHPAGFQQVQEELGVDGKGCVYVADNPKRDFAGPKSLGWRTVRVRRRLGLHSALESGSDVDHEITSLDQLEAVLAG
ncbi:MAG TPA: HAD family hydrolase [Acidimicrobiales bacterium]